MGEARDSSGDVPRQDHRFHSVCAETHRRVSTRKLKPFEGLRINHRPSIIKSGHANCPPLRCGPPHANTNFQPPSRDSGGGAKSHSTSTPAVTGGAATAEIPGTRINVLLADDYPLLRLGIRTLIEHEKALLVCGTAGNPGETLEAIARLKPDVVVIAFSLRSAATFALIEDARLHHGRTRLLVLSFKDDPILAKRVSLSGAQGFISRTDAAECVIEAIHRLAQGLTYVGAKTSSARADQEFDPTAQTCGPEEHSLTEREREILELIGGGSTPREIAEVLGLSIKTVESHRENIKEKLGIKTAAKLAPYAFHWVQSRRRH